MMVRLSTASEAAERLYASIGYVRVGVIPRFSLRPDSPELEDPGRKGVGPLGGKQRRSAGV
jgi:hypothetical protein